MSPRTEGTPNAMGNTTDLLDTVREAIAAQDPVLAEARKRLDLTRKIAMTFPGRLRTYQSGSLAHLTVNHPVTDGDGGLVLNRVYYPELGPDGKGETPTKVAADLCALLGPKIRETYRKARCGTSKRGPKITFGLPINGQDPSVDLVVALTRKKGSGLWIPNLHMDRWEAFDPEQHVELLGVGTSSLRTTRRRVIRLAKAWNKQWSQPAFSSFHLTALALEHVEPGMNIATGLRALFTEGAKFLATGSNTPDPAGVSKPLKLMPDVTRDDAVRRMGLAGEAMTESLENDDDPVKVQQALHRVFRKYIEAPASDRLAQAVAALRTGSRTTTTATVGLPGPAIVLPDTRAYGDLPDHGATTTIHPDNPPTGPTVNTPPELTASTDARRPVQRG